MCKIFCHDLVLSVFINKKIISIEQKKYLNNCQQNFKKSFKVFTFLNFIIKSKTFNQCVDFRRNFFSTFVNLLSSNIKKIAFKLTLFHFSTISVKILFIHFFL